MEDNIDNTLCFTTIGFRLRGRLRGMAGTIGKVSKKKPVCKIPRADA